MEYILVVTGVWMISMSLITRPQNFLSSVIFNIIPFFLGLGTLFVSAKLLSWI